jgi:hypothetical protein
MVQLKDYKLCFCVHVIQGMCCSANPQGDVMVPCGYATAMLRLPVIVAYSVSFLYVCDLGLFYAYTD